MSKNRYKPLTCESVKVDIVIRKNKEIPLDLIKQYCYENFDRYAFIKHDKDRNEDGKLQGVHYHICGEYSKGKVAFSTRLNEIVKFFKFDNAHGIEIDQYRTFEGALQYLTHKNQCDKYQYDKNNIIHNLSDSDFEIFYNATIGNVVTFELIMTACIDANNIIDVIRSLGIGNYRTYRSVVLDIWNEMSKRKVGAIVRKNNELPF